MYNGDMKKLNKFHKGIEKKDLSEDEVELPDQLVCHTETRSEKICSLRWDNIYRILRQNSGRNGKDREEIKIEVSRHPVIK